MKNGNNNRFATLALIVSAGAVVLAANSDKLKGVLKPAKSVAPTDLTAGNFPVPSLPSPLPSPAPSLPVVTAPVVTPTLEPQAIPQPAPVLTPPPVPVPSPSPQPVVSSAPPPLTLPSGPAPVVSVPLPVSTSPINLQLEPATPEKPSIFDVLLRPVVSSPVPAPTVDDPNFYVRTRKIGPSNPDLY